MGANKVHFSFSRSSAGKAIPLSFIRVAAIVAMTVSAAVAEDLYRLDAGIAITNSGVKLDVGSHAAPDVADWNNDGRKDLILGWFGSDLRVFLNQGTDSAPVFDGYLTVSGISLPYG